MTSEEACRQLQATEVLPALALRQLEEALLASAPRETYSLASSPGGFAGMWVGAVTSLTGLLQRDKNATEGRTKQPC